jgi:hypothetical protein
VPTCIYFNEIGWFSAVLCHFKKARLKFRIYRCHPVLSNAYSVADPHHFGADSDPPCHFDANPDSDPSFQINARTQIGSFSLHTGFQLQTDVDPDPAYHLDENADSAYYVEADPDPPFQFDADPCGSRSTTLQILHGNS